MSSVKIYQNLRINLIGILVFVSPFYRRHFFFFLGDNYAGGNPWQLLTAAHAEIFYLGASAWADIVMKEGNMRTTDEHSKWREILYLGRSLNFNILSFRIKPLISFTIHFLGADASLLDLAQAASSAGDAVMTRLWEYVKNDGGRIDEQIDKHTGAQTSAAALTWSYANILHALHTRNKLVEKLKQLP